MPAGPFLASRQFAIDVPNWRSPVWPSLSGSKDVDLYLTPDSPVILSDQGFPQADFDSASDAPNESLTITTRSPPQVSQPARYYIGVFNYSADTATFSVTATLSTTAPLSYSDEIARAGYTFHRQCAAVCAIVRSRIVGSATG